MSDPDRLPEIKAQLAAVDANKRVRSLGPNLTRVYLDWLVGEVERLRDEINERDYGWWLEDVHRNGDPLAATWEPIYPDAKDPREHKNAP